MSRRIKIDRKGFPIRNSDGEIIRTKPNTRTGAMVVLAPSEWEEPPMYFQSELNPDAPGL